MPQAAYNPPFQAAYQLKIDIGGSSLPFNTRKTGHIFTLTVDIEQALYTLADIHQQILLATSHENVMLPVGVDSILRAGSQQIKH